jgi:hypothetical protein
MLLFDTKRKKTVSMLKKSQASMPSAWTRRNRRHDTSMPLEAGRWGLVAGSRGLLCGGSGCWEGQFVVYPSASPPRVLSGQP